MNKEVKRVNITHNGQETSALNLLPEFDTQEIAVVDFQVLQRLSNLLPKAKFYEIKQAFKDALSNVNNIEDFVTLLSDELAFQTTVNVISKLKPEDIEDEPKVVGKINLDNVVKPKDNRCFEH